MKTQAKHISQLGRQLTTTLRHIASFTLKLPVLAMVLVISLPAVLYGQASLSLAQPPSTVVATGFSRARQVATDAPGNIYIPNNSGGITKITPGGTQSVIATGLSPNGIAVDGAGNVYATTGVSLVKITPSGAQTTLSSNFTNPTQVAVDGLGNIYVTDVGAGQVDEISAVDGFDVLVSNFPSPTGIAADKRGNVFLTRANSNQVYEASGSNLRSIVVSVNGPTSLAVDGNDNLFIADAGNNRVVEVPANSGPQFTIDSGVASTAIAVDGAGDLFVSNPTTNQLLKGSTMSANFGSVSTCSSNCGETITLTYAVTASGNLGQIRTLNQGSSQPSLDFNVTGSTCPGSLTAGSTCTVSIKFSPKYMRDGERRPGLADHGDTSVENAAGGQCDVPVNVYSCQHTCRDQIVSVVDFGVNTGKHLNAYLGFGGDCNASSRRHRTSQLRTATVRQHQGYLVFPAQTLRLRQAYHRDCCKYPTHLVLPPRPRPKALRMHPSPDYKGIPRPKSCSLPETTLQVTCYCPAFTRRNQVRIAVS